MRLFKNANYNFIGVRKYAYVFSGLLILMGIVSAIVHKGLNLSIDFEGGVVVQMKFEKDVYNDLGKIREIVTGLNFGSPEVKTIGERVDNEIHLILKRPKENVHIGEQITALLREKYPENHFEIRNMENVGPKIGKELTTNTLIAIVLSFLALIIYMAFRFKLPFGVAAVLSVVHDVLVTLSFFALFDAEVSIPVVVALLTLMGYSLNDTIVIFDRFRENYTGSTKGNFLDIINASVNQTLSRTIITGGLTFITVFAIFVFFFNTEDVMKYFALAMSIGVITGSYSTIYIASPLIIEWNKRRPIKNF